MRFVDQIEMGNATLGMLDNNESTMRGGARKAVHFLLQFPLHPFAMGIMQESVISAFDNCLLQKGVDAIPGDHGFIMFSKQISDPLRNPARFLRATRNQLAKKYRKNHTGKNLDPEDEKFFTLENEPSDLANSQFGLVGLGGIYAVFGPSIEISSEVSTYVWGHTNTESKAMEFANLLKRVLRIYPWFCPDSVKVERVREIKI